MPTELKLFCKDCNVPICRDCKISHHDGHCSEPLDKSVNQTKSDIDKSLQWLRTEELAEQAEILDRNSKDLSTSRETVAVQINNMAESLIKKSKLAITLYKQEMLKKLNAHFEEQTKVINDCKDRVNTDKDNRESSSSFIQAAIKHSKYAEIIMQEPQFRARIQQLTDEPRVKLPKELLFGIKQNSSRGDIESFIRNEMGEVDVREARPIRRKEKVQANVLGVGQHETDVGPSTGDTEVPESSPVRRADVNEADRSGESASNTTCVDVGIGVEPWDLEAVAKAVAKAKRGLEDSGNNQNRQTGESSSAGGSSYDLNSGSNPKRMRGESGVSISGPRFKARPEIITSFRAHLKQNAYGLAVNPITQDILVTEYSTTGSIGVYDRSGHLKDSIGSFIGLVSVVVLSDGSIVASDQDTGHLVVYSDPRSTSSWFPVPGCWGLAVNTKDEIAVACTSFRCVSIVKSDGTEIRKILKHDGIHLFKHPHYVAFSSAGNIIVSDFKKWTVTALSPVGVPLFVYGSQSSDIKQFKEPYGICVDAYDNILVVDKESNCIHLLRSNGQFVKQVVSQKEKLKYPYDVAIDLDGNLVVSTGKGTIKVYKYLE